MISYSHADWSDVEPVVKHLKAAGIPLWIDREQIKPTMIWRRELLNAPQHCDAIICFLSTNYLASEICRMELFLARNFDKPIFPVMVDECWEALDGLEESKNIASILAARLAVNKVVGLNTTREVVLTRLQRAVEFRLGLSRQPIDFFNVYISYPDGTAEFATKLHAAIDELPIRPWIATMNCEIGDDWRKSQTQAMSKARLNLIVMSEDFVGDAWRVDVLRTETLLAEAFDHPTLCIMSPALSADISLRNRVFNRLANGEQAFRRLTERQWFTPEHVGTDLKAEIQRLICLVD